MESSSIHAPTDITDTILARKFGARPHHVRLPPARMRLCVCVSAYNTFSTRLQYHTGRCIRGSKEPAHDGPAFERTLHTSCRHIHWSEKVETADSRRQLDQGLA
jgi:hypothetical protein